MRPDGEVRVLRSRGRVRPRRGGRRGAAGGHLPGRHGAAGAAAREVQLAREQAARVRAEAEEGRTSFLAEAGRVLSSSLDYETTLRNFAHLAVPRVADWCAIDVLDEPTAGRGGW